MDLTAGTLASDTFLQVFNVEVGLERSRSGAHVLESGQTEMESGIYVGKLNVAHHTLHAAPAVHKE